VLLVAIPLHLHTTQLLTSLAYPQLFGSGGTGGAKAPATVKNVEPKLVKTAKRQIIRWGPYKLQSAGVSFCEAIPFEFLYSNVNRRLSVLVFT
jgi:hypothetical protein